MVTYRDQDASDGGGPPMHRHEAPAPWLHHPSFQPANDRVVPPRRMDHTYRDYTYFPTGDLPAAAASTTPTTFPKKLHRLLSDPENEHIISWMPHGRAWKIHNKELLINEIAPKYFVQSKYQSFARQLNGWGFKRLHQAGNDFNAYYHECFLRGMPQLAALMKRASPKQGRLIPRVEAEPNFYEMEKFFKLPSLGMRPDQFQYPPTVASGPGYVFPPAPPSGYYNGSNDFSSYPGTYPPLPPPPFYHPDDPHAVAASYASNLGHPSYPPYYNPMPYSPPPPPLEQYPHFSHPSGLQYGAGSLHGVVSPSTSDPVSGEEASSFSYLPSSAHVSSSSPKDKIVVQEQPPQDDERK